ncbi:MAG: DUF4450 domain-containing protein [Prevotella sp.]|nr:DUF4450 domain-containing protein [Prevotella sp.]
MTILTIAAALMLATTSMAQDNGKKPPRTMNYYPDQGQIVCVNGNNRYTRALYGANTRQRLETSDRPVFASYDRDNSLNICFLMESNGQLQPLDSTTFCEARYEGGRRTYSLGDDGWLGGRVTLTAMATFYEEGAIWKIHTEGFLDPPALHAVARKLKKTKMTREGDYGLEPRSSFEAAGLPLQTLTWVNDSDTYILLTPQRTLVVDTLGEQHFAQEEACRQALISHLKISTPDPYINTLGASLAAAADGLWDGQTWLHGCCGWRTPLAGWRAAYVADVLGWDDRARSHFDAYAKSMVTDVPPVIPHPSQDSIRNLARAEEKWGTQMYSNGYICKLPGDSHKMSHYDMNLNYIDELLWHFCYDADPAYMRKMWPVIKLHLEWEKRNFDPDGDHLYDAYCCIWASDALYYNGGAVTHSSAYNYRGNLLAARIAELIGENPEPYRKEAEAILKAMNQRLWMNDEGHWAEYQDLMGLKRQHTSAALWTIYTPIDCGACSHRQAWEATLYADRHFPHIPVECNGEGQLVAEEGANLYTLSTTDWLPYDWSTNNVAHEEVMNMALAYFIAGRRNEGYRLLKSDIIDGMFLGACPGNFGQISYYDKARSEAYRDFGDNIGISARAIVNGLFGIRPDALNGRCYIQYSLPDEWNDVEMETPYIKYHFQKDGKRLIYHVSQHFKQPLDIIVRVGLGDGRFVDFKGTNATEQTITADLSEWEMKEEPSAVEYIGANNDDTDIDLAGLAEFIEGVEQTPIDLSKLFNANVDDIYRNEYLSPRPPYTTLQLPKQGIGQWCLPDRTAHIEDDGLRQKVVEGMFDTGLGVSFRTPAEGHNIIYTSQWDNYPESVTIKLKGKAAYACLMLAGSTNNMQSRIDNGIVVVEYKDHTADTLHLVNPVNWCPIEQDYYLDGLAFTAAQLRPYRVHLGSGKVSRNIGEEVKVASFANSVPGNPDSAEPRVIDCGAAQILKMPLNPEKRLKRLTLRTLSNDVVIGLMAVTLTN